MIANRTRQGPPSGPSKNRNNPATGKYGGIVCTHCGDSEEFWRKSHGDFYIRETGATFGKCCSPRYTR